MRSQFLVLWAANLALSTAAMAAALPNGTWSGDRMRLVVDGTAATLEGDCAEGRIVVPIEVGDDGSFAAKGSFVLHAAGPQRAESPSKADLVLFSGRVDGETIRLSIQRSGGQAALEFTLRRGATFKLVRCL